MSLPSIQKLFSFRVSYQLVKKDRDKVPGWTPVAMIAPIFISWWVPVNWIMSLGECFFLSLKIHVVIASVCTLQLTLGAGLLHSWKRWEFKSKEKLMCTLVSLPQPGWGWMIPTEECRDCLLKWLNMPARELNIHANPCRFSIIHAQKGSMKTADFLVFTFHQQNNPD